MFFGMCNSPATFQAMMNNILSDFIDKNWLVVYMDNILICSEDPQTHQECTHQIIQCLKDNDLYAKWEKSYFDVTEVEFLGMIICPKQITMDPAKLKGIADWPTPSTVKQVQSFLGFGNLYRKFIHDYLLLTCPLHELTHKGTTWD